MIVQVINPDGEVAVVPYRFQVERAIEPDVTIGLGGPRYIFAGDSAAYSVALQNLGNVDAPYVMFSVGIPELGVNQNVYGLPYSRFTTNLRGRSEDPTDDVPWPELDSVVNLDGHVTTGGYLFDQHADGLSGFTFQVQTYPGLRELHDHSWDAFKAKLYETFPAYAATDFLADGPSALDKISPGLSLVWESFGAIPDLLTQPLIPFQFHVVASATALTRDEFLSHALGEADQLRQGILADPNVDPALASLAANVDDWRTLYVRYLTESGRLREVDSIPPIRRDQDLSSLIALLAGGVLSGPGGDSVRLSGRFEDFFDNVRRWYGHDPSLRAEQSTQRSSFSSDSLSFLGILQNPNPIAEIPGFEQYDLDAESNTHYQTMRVYVPWVPFAKRGSGIPPNYQVSGIQTTGEDAFFPLNLQAYYDQQGASSGSVSQTGPFTLDAGGFVSSQSPQSFSVHFQNTPGSTRDTNEIRVVVPLDDVVDPSRFRLGDLTIGDLTIRVPVGRSFYQDDIDLVADRGFDVRISAGVDLKSNAATWLIQAIDPLTGEVRTSGEGGLLPPNNAQGLGAGSVSYSIELADTVGTGDGFVARAQVLLDNAAPEHAAELQYLIDADAPISLLETESLDDASAYRIRWNATDQTGGSGFKHVTIYVAEDGGDFKIWKRQIQQASGEAIYSGSRSKDYEFLALATDRAGNREQPPSGRNTDDDGSTASAQSLSGGIDSAHRFGSAVDPIQTPSPHPLFAAAEEQVPSDGSTDSTATFHRVLQPFQAETFASGFATSSPERAVLRIGPMAIAETPEGDILVSGGASRNQLYRFSAAGGQADQVWAELDHPIFNLAFDLSGRLWATTAGGPLLELDPTDGRILASHGEGITMGLAVDPESGDIIVGSRHGIERFDPTTESFTRLSRDRDLRIGSLAFADDGTLFGVVWPDRDSVVKFGDSGRAENVLDFDTPIDSIAIGRPGTSLAGLMFVTHNAGIAGQATATKGDRSSELTMVDLATMRRVAIADGGTRGDVATTTSDGRLLISQSESVDVLRPLQVPEIVATHPSEHSLVALPLGSIRITFSEDMFTGSGTETHSVLNPGNYKIEGPGNEHPTISEVRYHQATRTATLLA